ncbi:MAG TPA: DivIVA domain-containing protein, partial [Deltaproteobacteria bacterium]|nr:DivIVA domain-containing protein [Deltaproteobacteria bacterium]
MPEEKISLLRERVAELEALERKHHAELTRLTEELDKIHNDRVFSEAIIRSSPVFIVAIGAEGDTIMMNDALLANLGYNAEEVDAFLGQCSKS